MIVRARAPLRIGLAGGGSDVSPYCDLHGGYVLNAAIDRHAYAVITPLDEDVVRFHAKDKQEVFEQPFDTPVELDGHLNLHKAVYRHIINHYNNGRPLALELCTFCEAPIGSGLGSSSTLVVAMLRAFVELLNLPLDDYGVANLAFQIERMECSLQGGRQDQYSAAFGGFNFMEFYAGNRTVVNPLRIKNWIICELESSLVLHYTGVSRDSAAIIQAQTEVISAGRQKSLEAMHGIKLEAVSMKEALLRGDFRKLVESMRAGWENKKRSADAVSNPHIDAVHEAALSAGALAGKVSGAGGGGFMLFFVPPHRRMDVFRALASFPGQSSGCHFFKYGAQAWKID